MKKTSWLACALLLGACGSNGIDPEPTPDSGVPIHGDPPPPPDPVDCAGGDVARFSGELTALSDRAPIAGAQVCVLEHDEIPCATTDASGFWQLDCAPRGDAAIWFRADGFAPGVWLWAGPAGEAYEDLDVSLARDAENSGYLSPTGVTYPDGTSSLVTIVARGNSAGMTAVLRSGSGEGPFYSADQGGRIDPALTALPSADELVFFVAQPWSGWQEIEIELLSAGGGACQQDGGAWTARDGAPNVVRLPIRAGTESVMWVSCL